jgi:ABC-type transport system involved in cytochrome c biogenesis permease subunit
VFGWTERESASLYSAARWWTGGGLALIVLGVVLGGFWARSHMGRFWGWDIRETAALGLLLWNGLVLGLLAWRPRQERLIMLLGQAGNVVIALCWFGPALLAVGLHSYGTVSTSVLPMSLAGFVLLELALAGLTFVPPGRLSFSRS